MSRQGSDLRAACKPYQSEAGRSWRIEVTAGGTRGAEARWEQGRRNEQGRTDNPGTSAMDDRDAFALARAAQQVEGALDRLGKPTSREAPGSGRPRQSEELTDRERQATRDHGKVLVSDTRRDDEMCHRSL